jgi:serine/threonine protein kinase
MLGGNIRGQGTYGCIFQPALKCRGKNNKERDSSMVGKITSHRDAKNELEISRILRNIPDSSNYVIMAEPEKCTPRSKSKQDDPDIERCRLLHDIKLQNTIQMIMPWGGYPLSRINLDPYIFDFFKFMEELLACGSFLLLNDICHFDMSGENFLFDRHNKPKIIDFGFGFKASNLTIHDLAARWRVIGFDHDTETPEVTLILGKHHNMATHDMIHRLEREKPALKILSEICNVNPVHWSGELYAWSKDSKSFQQHDWLNCWKLYWPGFDAWSIGTILLGVLEVQLSIPAFVNSNAWMARGDKTKEILRGICRASPVYRLDTAEALTLINPNHPLISSGSVGHEWVSKKKQNRPLEPEENRP